MSKLGFRARVAFDAMTFGPARRRRSMTRALRQLDELAPLRADRRRRRVRIPTGVVVVAALFAGGVLLFTSGALSASHLHNTAGTTLGGQSGATRLADVPTTTRLTTTARLLPAPAPAHSSTSYKVMNSEDGHPVTWEPCRPIHYVIRQAEEPRQFDALLQQAIGDVSRATGLKFVSDGPTSELLLRDPKARLIYQPRKYGDRWAPVLVTWSDPGEAPELAGKEAGFAGPDRWAPPGGPQRYVSGLVAYSVPDLLTLYARPHGATLVREVLLHELGHLVGLDHVSDKNQLMYPTLTHPMPGFGAGDLAGLARLGEGSCYTDY